MSFWLVLVLFRDWINVLLLFSQTIGCVLAFLTLIGTIHVLLFAQLVASLGFGVLLVRTGYQMAQLPGS